MRKPEPQSRNRRNNVIIIYTRYNECIIFCIDINRVILWSTTFNLSRTGFEIQILIILPDDDRDDKSEVKNSQILRLNEENALVQETLTVWRKEKNNATTAELYFLIL